MIEEFIKLTMDANTPEEAVVRNPKFFDYLNKTLAIDTIRTKGYYEDIKEMLART